jgi:hypothetical protein
MHIPDDEMISQSGKVSVSGTTESVLEGKCLLLTIVVQATGSQSQSSSVFGAQLRLK